MLASFETDTFVCGFFTAMIIIAVFCLGRWSRRFDNDHRRPRDDDPPPNDDDASTEEYDDDDDGFEVLSPAESEIPIPPIMTRTTRPGAPDITIPYDRATTRQPTFLPTPILPCKAGTGDRREQPGKALNPGTGDKREKPGKALKSTYPTAVQKSWMRLQAFGGAQEHMVEDPPLQFQPRLENPDATVHSIIQAGFDDFVRDHTLDLAAPTARVAADCGLVFIDSKDLRHCGQLLSTRGSNQHMLQFTCRTCGSRVASWSIRHGRFV